MQFILECHDKQGALDLRLATRSAHLAYLDTQLDKILIAGPILGDDGKPVGSLLIVDFPDAAAVQAFADADPYTKAGLFATVTIRPFRKVLPA